MSKLALVVIASCLCLPMTAAAQEATKNLADVVFFNGNIYVGNSSAVPGLQRPNLQRWKSRRPTALAVSNGKVLALGSDEQVKKMAGEQTRMVDLQGKFVMPGFNDAHLHLASGGFEKLNVDLVGTRSLEEMLQRIAQRAQSTPEDEWITGRGWDHTKWTVVQLPSRQDLDKVTGGRPAVFRRVDGHISVANTAALKAAGIDGNTKPPEGGQIDLARSGEPTGILRETAMPLVDRLVPEPTPGQRRRAIELALQEAARWGITSAQDNSSWEDFLVYEELRRNGGLTVRISEWLPFDNSVERLKKQRAHHPASDRMLHTGMLKGFMDGSLGSRTAALLHPYSDDGQNAGLPRYSQERLNKMVAERDRAGFQIGLHAIGDKGTEMALDAFAAALPAAQSRARADRRFRIEHAQVTTPRQFRRFRELGVVASMQPNHLLTDMNWAKSRVGEERARHSYAWRSFLENRVPLAFGTDYPVEPITPFRGLYAAVTRQNEAGTETYFPEQKLTIEEAISAYTLGAAYAEFAERSKGTLEPGMLADFVVLDRDITAVPADEILRARVLRTVVGGDTVFQASQ